MSCEIFLSPFSSPELFFRCLQSPKPSRQLSARPQMDFSLNIFSSASEGGSLLFAHLCSAIPKMTSTKKNLSDTDSSTHGTCAALAKWRRAGPSTEAAKAQQLLFILILSPPSPSSFGDAAPSAETSRPPQPPLRSPPLAAVAAAPLGHSLPVPVPNIPFHLERLSVESRSSDVCYC